MNPPSGPLEVFQSVARSVLGRVLGFFLACSLGGGMGYLIDYWLTPESEWFTEGLWLAMTVIPQVIVSVFTSYGLLVFPACLLFAFVFIRFELSLWWLLLPFVLVTWQTSILGM